MQIANHLFPDKRTEKLMAERLFRNKDAELSGARLLEQAGSCRCEAKRLRWLRARVH
jgi:hypothetical protein